MIMKVRLEAMNKYKKLVTKSKKKIYSRYQLANKYFKFLGARSKKKSFSERKKWFLNFKRTRKKGLK